MSSAPALFSIELELARVRELSKNGRHNEALAAADALAAKSPENRDAVYLGAANLRCLNRIPEAMAALLRLEQQHPRFSLLYQERGHCCVALRDASGAIEAFLRGVTLNPALVQSWTMLERLYVGTGDLEKAARAAEQLAALKRLPPKIVSAGSLFSDGDFSAAESILLAYVQSAGEDAEALRLLGRIKHQYGDLYDAELRLGAALKMAPDYRAARADYARVLLDRQKYSRAEEEIGKLLQLEPANVGYLCLSAAARAGLGRHEEAIELYRKLLAAAPKSAELCVALGHSLQILGCRTEAVEFFRAAAAIRPSFGDAYWSLANLKTYRFSDEEVARMRAGEAAPETLLLDHYHLCFALGKAYEDRREYEDSWKFYERGNQLKRSESRYRPDPIETNVCKQIEICTASFFAARSGFGAPEPDPIFIVGLPRSGSTLLEQILASHSQVEATQELPHIPQIVVELQKDGLNPDHSSYPAALAELSLEELRGFGERYLSETRVYRSGKPFFIDKMPNNFRHVGLIHLMLPNARIIDARREPMACCFSNLKQLFAAGQEFSYGIEEIARYYRVYLDLMLHWDAVLPGKVLRVLHEDVVQNLEASVRRILQFCALPFEPACIEFHKTERSILTASSEQVRQPIFREGLFQWRNYEPWLGPLQDALGDALVRYRPRKVKY